MEPIPQSHPDLIPYLAGFIDGEGCLTFNRQKGERSARTLLAVANTDRRPLDLFAATFGGRIHAPRPAAGRWRVVYQWHLYAGDLLPFLPRLIPHLIVKRTQAELLLEYLRFFPPGPLTVPVPSPEEEYREALIACVHALNRRGAEATSESDKETALADLDGLRQRAASAAFTRRFRFAIRAHMCPVLARCVRIIDPHPSTRS